MKAPKLLLASFALFLSVAAFSQTDSTKAKTDTSAHKKDASSKLQDGGTASTSASATSSATITTADQTFPAPNHGRYYIPVLGSYQPQAGGDVKTVTITADESNPGKVWIEGLTSTKIYALLKTAPGTYKIPVQKQDNTTIQEGTVQYDENSKLVTICVGCGFQDQNSSTSTATLTETTTSTSKSKAVKPAKTIINFSGTKTNQGTAKNG